jgi:cellulose synthase/poly-beta-1,6-N-acetylglucosamine synthase-like glycosyltransferase
VHGKNLKVSNLINLAERAKYGRIVIADSDIAVQPDYLERVTAPLADPSVGVVTCLYHARSVGGFWTRIGAQFVDAWLRRRCGSRTWAARAASGSARRSPSRAIRSIGSAVFSR